MFQNAFQSGPSVEILSSCDKSPIWSVNKANWKLFEKVVKGYVILVDSHNTKIHIPTSEKQSLSLVQPYLVLQIYIIPSQPFTLELLTTDISNSKRRLVFSSASKDLTVNPMHARIPNASFVRGCWANISIDMARCITACFPGNTYRSLESIIISSFCKIRRVFTMRGPIMDTTGIELKSDNCEQIPKNIDFLSGVSFVNQLIEGNIVQALGETVEVKCTPKNNARPPLTTAPIAKIPRGSIRTSSVGKKQGNTTTTFFQRKQESAASPLIKESSKAKKRESPRLNARQLPKPQLTVAKPEELKVEKIEFKEEIDPRFDDFNHLTNYKNSDEIMSNSIEEEIEVDSVNHDVAEFNGYGHHDHHYFPIEEIEVEVQKPTYFTSGINEATQYRPYTPPFAGLSSMKNVAIPSKDNEEEALELIYDPVLQCYYDPNTHEYYQVDE